MSQSVGSSSTVRTTKQFIEGYSNHLKVGIIGKPNAGKSSLFNLYTKESETIAETDECLFCTIDPSITVHTCDDERFEWLQKTYTPRHSKRCMASLVDTQGLVKGSILQGKGVCVLSAQQNLKQTDVIVHLVRVFENDDVGVYEGSMDPLRDIQTVNHEILLMDLDTIERGLMEIERVQQNRLGGETLSWQYTTLCKLWEHVAGTTRPKPSEAELKKSKTLFRKVIIPKVAVGIPLRYGTYTNREKIFMSTYQFITAKEMIYLLNTTSRNYLRGGVEAPALQPILAEIISMDQFSIAMAVSIEFEQSLERVTEESDKTVFYLGSHCLSRNFDVDMGSDIDDIKGTGPESIEPLAAYKLANPTHKSCIPIVIKECYRALNLIHFYVLVPGRELTVYCLRQGATIVEAASKVDENIARNFIRGEVMIYDELRDLNGDKVKLMMTGGVKAQAKKYIVNDGDIIEFFYHGREKPL